MSKVDQRNVIQVLDYGFADDGTPFLVMEHLRGRDLRAVLALAESPLPVDEVADIGLGVCAALRACHRVGIIHRDLKAANVFLVDTDTGMEIKVLDFGVSNAAAADDRTRAVQLTAPHHLAPEQIDGKVGPASDQYALGVLLYFCVTRQFPQRLRGARPPVKPDRACRLRWTPFWGARHGWAPRSVSSRSSRSGASCWNSRVNGARRNGALYYHPDGAGASVLVRRAGDADRETRPRAAGPGACTTSVDAARAVTATKVSRRAGRDARAGGLGAAAPARLGGGWRLRAASIGCVALAAAGLASGRRRPPAAGSADGGPAQRARRSGGRRRSADSSRPAPAAPETRASRRRTPAR